MARYDQPVQEPQRAEDGAERHPAWGMIAASRVQAGPPGAVLFDSDIRHNHYVTVRLAQASRRRDLNRDWKHAEEAVVEIAMSEAQWASFVSSMGIGSGVPCTIEHVEGDRTPAFPYEPRLQESMQEVRGAADKALQEIREAFEAYEAHKVIANLRRLKYAIANAPANMAFAAESLSEAAEDVVVRTRADLEAAVAQMAERAGLDPGDVAATLPELTGGDDA